jgi:hypothetical protein
MSDPRDRDFQWTEHSMNYTVTDTGVIKTGKVWRWQVHGRRVVSQRGLFGWLRPTVRDRSLAELMEATAAKARDNLATRLF